MKIEGLLPIGSIVRITAAPQQQLQLVGQCQVSDGNKRISDYSAVLFPQGYYDGEHLVLVNNDDICQIDAYGYVDDDSIEYTEIAENTLEMLRDGRLTLDDLASE